MRPDREGPGGRPLTTRIRAEAQRLGFFKTGMARAGPLPQSERFDSWLQGGMHGEMRYMRRQAERRKDPRLILESVRSIIVCAMNYHSVEHPFCERPECGRISRYAWGDDYHEIVSERLRQLRESIQIAAPEALCLDYVDTGPVMEKVWGAQTSLGWMGKHSNLITREQGSWFFVGVILTDLELEYDTPEHGFCGTCSRCIPACPTGAIVAPYIVDARLCISYLTIELRGPIPRPQRTQIGNRILGCDDCQEVCPWNRFSVRTPEAGFQPRDGNLMPLLSSLVSLTEPEFNERFKRSPVRRAKRDGFVRNVAVALGNSGDPAAVAPLRRALRDSSALVRAHAAWGLGQLGGPEAYRLLRRALDVESDPGVIEEIKEALG